MRRYEGTATRTPITFRISANIFYGIGTNTIMRQTGKSRTCVWRWQERLMQEGVDGLFRDKTRPSRIPRLDQDVADRVAAAPASLSGLRELEEPGQRDFEVRGSREARHANIQDRR